MESIKNQLEEVRSELRSLLAQTCGDAELRAMFNDTICELKAKEALLKTKRIKTDKVTPNVARIQRQLGASLLPW